LGEGSGRGLARAGGGDVAEIHAAMRFHLGGGALRLDHPKDKKKKKKKKKDKDKDKDKDKEEEQQQQEQQPRLWVSEDF